MCFVVKYIIQTKFPHQGAYRDHTWHNAWHYRWLSDRLIDDSIEVPLWTLMYLWEHIYMKWTFDVHRCVYRVHMKLDQAPVFFTCIRYIEDAFRRHACQTLPTGHHFISDLLSWCFKSVWCYSQSRCIWSHLEGYLENPLLFMFILSIIINYAKEIHQVLTQWAYYRCDHLSHQHITNCIITDLFSAESNPHLYIYKTLGGYAINTRIKCLSMTGLNSNLIYKVLWLLSPVCQSERLKFNFLTLFTQTLYYCTIFKQYPRLYRSHDYPQLHWWRHRGALHTMHTMAFRY